jgi:hypothetical protein
MKRDQPEGQPQLAAVGVRRDGVIVAVVVVGHELGYAAMRALIAMASTCAARGVAGAVAAPRRRAPRPARSDRLVDFSQKPPYVNALDVDRRAVTSSSPPNRGFFRTARTAGRSRGCGAP